MNFTRILLVLMLQFSGFVMAANLESFSVNHLDCSGARGFDSGIIVTKKPDGLLTVKAELEETVAARIKDGSGQIFVLDDKVLLAYETYNPTGPGDVIPACAFPVELTYKISGMPDGQYQYTLLDLSLIKLYALGLLALVAVAGMFVLWKVRRRRGI